MNNEDKNFVDYVRDCIRKGLSHSQIARSIGMSLAHFENRIRDISIDGPSEPKIVSEEPAETTKPAPRKRTSKKAKTEEKENNE